MIAYVYLVSAQVGYPFVPIKIGASENPLERMAALQAGCPGTLRLLATIDCRSLYSARDLEHRLHLRLRALRIRGEWFRDEPMLWECVAQQPGFCRFEVAA